ncbi:MAG TPA: LysR family transcriptional regulator [Hyphomicrobiaceae bacterium]|nr:LysR family transcriptional regulator [Hyphomicrobiaceae bacterium]
MFDWNDLRYFLAVARSGSTLAAARLLDVSQPTVQRRLAVLERQTGRSLVERHPTGYRLTDVGKDLLPYAERIEQHVHAFERQLAASDDELTGTIRITCPEADIDHLLASVLSRFQAENPGLRLEFLVTDRALDLAKGEADVALRGGPQPDSALIGRKIADCPWLVYASRSYVERYGKPREASEINQHAVIAYTGRITELRPVRWLRSISPHASIAAYSNTVLGALSAAKSGLGLVMLPAHVGDREDDLICVVEPQPELIEPFTLLVHPDLRDTPRVRALLDFLASQAGTLRSLFRGKACES